MADHTADVRAGEFERAVVLPIDACVEAEAGLKARATSEVR
jgi:hypothetical protein